jgi:hypothetical protein
MKNSLGRILSGSLKERRHVRVQSIILSHILLRVEPAKLEILSDQFRRWRVARAISNGLLVLSMGVGAVLVAPFFVCFELERGRALTAIIVGVGFFVLSWFLTRQTYYSYCLSLFSLLFALSKTDRSGQE